MEYLVHTIFVLVGMDRVANLVGLSKSGRTINVFFFSQIFLQGVSLAGNGDCERREV